MKKRNIMRANVIVYYKLLRALPMMTTRAKSRASKSSATRDMIIKSIVLCDLDRLRTSIFRINTKLRLI